MKTIIITGASSGMGCGVARLFIAAGWKVAVAARREAPLRDLKALAPDRVEVEVLDVTAEDAPSRMEALIERMEGVDYYLNAAGVGLRNSDLSLPEEERSMQVNVIGFTRLVDVVFNYMKVHGGGHIGIISSVAGTRGMAASPSYSATKRYQYCYIQSLAQLSHNQHYGITFTDIRPGFVDTAFLNPQKKYPFLMKEEKACRIIYRALLKKKRVKTFDWKFRCIVALWKIIPRGVWERMNVNN